MSTQMIIYLCGSLLIIAIFARWSWQQEKDKDITLSDLTFFIFVSFILGLLSWAGVIIWLFSKMDKYSDKVIIRRKRNRTMSKAEKFIEEHTKNSYNYNSYAPDPIPWLTPDQARKAVEIAREEIYEWLEKNIYMYNGECEGDRKEIINDLKQAMKDE